MEPEEPSFEVELASIAASREIEKAVRGGHRAARAYVKTLRAVYPNKSPAELVTVLENLHTGFITAAGGAITGGEVGLGLLAKLLSKPGGSGAVAIAKQAGMLLATIAGPRLLRWLDKQSRFQITAGFALAMAEIHSLKLDKEQARALVYLLTTVGVSSSEIATIVHDLAQTGAARRSTPDAHWAITLAEHLRGSTALGLIEEVAAEQGRNYRETLTNKQRAAFDVGAAAVLGGASRFGFGAQVAKAARGAFPAPPAEFPEHLQVARRDSRKADRRASNFRPASTVRDFFARRFARKSS